MQQDGKFICSQKCDEPLWCVQLCGQIPNDLANYHEMERPCFGRKAEFPKAAIRISKSVVQPIKDQWLGIGLQNIDNSQP